MKSLTIKANTVMSNALRIMIIATFMETLPEHVRKEIEDKGYEIVLSDKMITLIVTKDMCNIISNYNTVGNEDENHRRFYDENGNLIEEECKNFLNELHIAGITPDDEDTELEVEPDSDMDTKNMWIQGKCIYRILLKNFSTSGAIQAAKKFAAIKL